MIEVGEAGEGRACSVASRGGDREKRRGWIEIGPAPSTFQLGSERKMANRTDVEVNQRGELVGWMDGWGRLPPFPQSSSFPFFTSPPAPVVPSHSNIGPNFPLCRRESSFDRWKRAVSEYVWNGSLSTPDSWTVQVASWLCP